MTRIEPTSAAAARDRVESGALLVDVRSDAGRAASGAITGASIVAKTDVAAFAATQDPNREVVIFCGTTAGSAPVVAALAEAGFTAVSHVEGGFEALAAEGLPTTRVVADEPHAG
ncbi:MAG: Rhodanese domain protein [Microbacteriaceae bacterium]|jgi:rhodanese-related sulfurtransferase|nr:Rhodanese domain protein [Microbacteriaceae bacterium]